MSRMSERSRLILVALIAIHVLVPIALLIQHSGAAGDYAKTSDAARYQTIAQEPGRPYVDNPVEYPPLAVAYFKGVGTADADFNSFFQRLVLTQALADAIIIVSLFWAWGRRAAMYYLALSIPLLAFMLSKFDLAVVAFAVA